MITMDAFITEFEKIASKTKWKYNDRLTLRNECDECPMEAYAREKNGSFIETKLYSEQTGLSKRDVYDIIQAADNLVGYDPVLRQKLIDICKPVQKENDSGHED